MTTCICSNPPGGGGTCSFRQIAICRSDGINCYVSCIDIPEEMLSRVISGRISLLEVYKFLNEYFEEEYEPVQVTTRWETKLFTKKSGILINKDNKDVIKFTLPKRLAKKYKKRS